MCPFFLKASSLVFMCHCKEDRHRVMKGRRKTVKNRLCIFGNVFLDQRLCVHVVFAHFSLLNPLTSISQPTSNETLCVTFKASNKEAVKSLCISRPCWESSPSVLQVLIMTELSQRWRMWRRGLLLWSPCLVVPSSACKGEIGNQTAGCPGYWRCCLLTNILEWNETMADPNRSIFSV